MMSSKQLLMTQSIMASALSVNRKDIMQMEKLGHERLRQRIAANMNRETVPDEAWEMLLAKGHIQKLSDGDTDEEGLTEIARPLTFYADLVAQARAVIDPEGGGWKVSPPPSDGYEADHVSTLVKYLELKAAARPGVIAWRRSYVPEPLSRAEAYELVEKPEIRNKLSGIRDVEDKKAMPSGRLPLYASEGRRVQCVGFYPRSGFEELRKLSKELRKELFPLWTLADAAWIVVTGEVREVPKCLLGEIHGFSNRHLTYGTINLRIEPWITGETVLRAYQHLQALALARRPRALSERNLAMARFVMEQLDDIITGEAEEGGGPPRVSWRRLMARWNQEYPEWAFQDERNFFRDCRRTIRAVARPYDEKRLQDRSGDHPPSVSVP